MEKGGPFIWTNLNPLHRRMHCAKFGWNCPSGSGERVCNFVNVFLLFCNYLHLEKGGALYLKKIESSSPKNALFEVLLKLAQWFWRRRWKCEVYDIDNNNHDGQQTNLDLKKLHLNLRLRWANKEWLVKVRRMESDDIRLTHKLSPPPSTHDFFKKKKIF